MSAIKLILGLVLLGSTFSRNVETRVPILPSGFYEGTGIPIQHPNGHITGGEEATPYEFPWQTAIYINLGSYYLYICGGVIISNDYVLTAAHCTVGETELEVRMGVHDRTANEPSLVSRTVVSDNWKEHENYVRGNVNYDIALIQLDPPIQFNRKIRPITLNKVEPPPRTTVTLTGWGRTGDDVGEGDSNVLLKVDVVVGNDRLCKREYGDKVIQDWNSVICVKTNQTDIFKSACRGDSGGPMMYDGPDGMVLNGVTSFGSYSGCEKGIPIGYTSVPYYYDWIIENTSIEA